jgi:hypothetical protein
MGLKLFGIDIAKTVYTGIKAVGNVVPLTLVKVTPGTRTPAAPLDGTNPTEASHPGHGFGSDPAEETRGHLNTPGDIYQVRVTEISILAASLPAGIEPTPNDKVVFAATIPGIGGLAGTWYLEKVKTDPARAMFICQARS